jgi:hypothetical protein
MGGATFATSTRPGYPREPTPVGAATSLPPGLESRQALELPAQHESRALLIAAFHATQ